MHGGATNSARRAEKRRALDQGRLGECGWRDTCGSDARGRAGFALRNWHLRLSLGGGEGPRGYPCGGEMGSPSPPQAPIFWGFLFARFFTCFMGIRRTCGHAITPCDSLSAQLTVP